MLRVSKLTDYATSIMTALAQQPAAVRNATELAAVTHVAAPTVSKVLKRLAQHGLVISVRGAHGGYRLAKSPQTISMAEIVAAMEGPIALTECAHFDSHCVIESHCGVRANWQKINAAVLAALQEISLTEMTLPLSSVAITTKSTGSEPTTNQFGSPRSLSDQVIIPES